MELQPTEEILAQKIQELESLAEKLAELTSKQLAQSFLSEEDCKDLAFELSHSRPLVQELTNALITHQEIVDTILPVSRRALEDALAEHIAAQVQLACGQQLNSCREALERHAIETCRSALSDHIAAYQSLAETPLRKYIRSIAQD